MENIEKLIKQLDNAFDAYYNTKKRYDNLYNEWFDCWCAYTACDKANSDDEIQINLRQNLLKVLDASRKEIDPLQEKYKEYKKIYDDLKKKEQEFIKPYTKNCIFRVEFRLYDDNARKEFLVKYNGKIKDFTNIYHEIEKLIHDKIKANKIDCGWCSVPRRIETYVNVSQLLDPNTLEYNDFVKEMENL